MPSVDNRKAGLVNVDTAATYVCALCFLDRPLHEVTWPDTLRKLEFQGPYFNQPIVDTPLPRDLEVLKFGDGYDQPLESISWPRGLREVELGRSFQQSMESVVWPKTLRSITALDIDLGEVPEGCRVGYLPNLEEEAAAVIFMLMDGIYPYVDFPAADTDDEDDAMFDAHFEHDAMLEAHFLEAMSYGNIY